MSDRLQEAASGKTGPKKGFSAWIGGRANRKSYWLWVGPMCAALVVIGMVGIPGLELVFALPLLFVWIRRFHDLGRSGWWAPLINVAMSATTTAVKFTAGPDASLAVNGVLAVGAIVVLGVLPGQATTNRFGPPTGKAGELAETFS
ncbi:DUF805 domain-containing protein [Phenylobacterium sp.]|uniref:DUF805 domain-containing protein n=1 Tax=Phenylobacterium sp. TaxID=1871053 RepID=UPI002ED8EA5A